ncbi:Ribonuclease I precursor [Pseudomonas synxantha]|uniref:ribonuclease T2 family protein n=1 Tax=Pseudomonas synxantha TaxID=47883 RepID=UPI000F5691C1|nr:ribonuclease [Pseudomonas synxantha]AZE70847.1 Ribonuclease I precursor [Pseudomonas synxantha]AZE76394.1 Ribonuclease I precursor [Pseudomonas synxantha]
MKRTHLIATVMATLTISHSVQALDANEEFTPTKDGYQYLVYAVTWQPGFCKLRPATAGCDKPPQKFLTHGIWPYNDSLGEKTNRHPVSCNTAPSCKSTTNCAISQDTLDAVAADPEIAPLITVAPQGMLKDVWSKHGTCAGKTEEDYFADFAKLRKVVSYNEPMFNAWVGRSVMFDQLKAAFPGNTAFRCFTLDGKQYLHEVFYMIKPDGTPYEGNPNLQIGPACASPETFIPGEI